MEEEKKEGQQTLPEEGQGYSSQWRGKLEDAIGKILDRKDFSYDLNGDALYQQYKDRYVQQGKMAMMDTLGQASSLTGGYGNSYAQGAGQQAYQSYLQGLTDKIPELYQLALDKYDREGQGLSQRYAMLGQLEGQDYDRYQQNLDRDQQAWENALRLYQLGVQTPEILETLGIPVEPEDGGGDGGGSSSGGSGGRGKAPAQQDNTVEEVYRQAKQSGASARQLDNYLRSAIVENKISKAAATELRNKRW